jgi:DNA-binding Lrp family transcriptional regulator
MKESRENMKVKGEQRLIELRRARIMELLSNGHTSQVSIAETLNVSEPTVSHDVRFLKDRAKKELESHFQERLPFEYARALAGINSTLTRVSELLKEAKDPKTKIECMKLQMDLWKSVMSMATDGGIIERAIKIVKGFEHEDMSKVKMSSDKKEDDGEEDIEDDEDFEDEEITVNDEDEILNEEEEDLREEE